LLERAIAIDRRYGLALSWTAVCHHLLVRDGWAEDPEKAHRKAVDLARQALQVTENDPSVLANTALVLAYSGEDISIVIELVDRALGHNPSFARGWHIIGLLRNFAGRPDLAIEHVKTALRLSSRERIGLRLMVLGGAYFFKRQFEGAASKLLLAIQITLAHPHTATSRRATPTWAGSTKRERLSSDCA
jgi:tetratricopeptide (TPR) repeat protein